MSTTYRRPSVAYQRLRKTVHPPLTQQKKLDTPTPFQKIRIIQAQSEYNKHTTPLFLGSRLPNSPDIKADLRRFENKYRNDLIAVLTPAQKTKWKQLSTKPPLPGSAPETPLPTEADLKRINVKEQSDLFRAIVHLQNENELKLSAAQNKFLDELYFVTERGLFSSKE